MGRPATIVILCPTRLEARGARRALSSLDARDRERVAVRTIGVGPASHDRVEREARSGATAILFGLAGGLCPTEAAPAIGQVVRGSDPERRWTCPVRGAGQGTLVVGVDRPVGDPEAKRELHERTGASIVDMESHLFAAACDEHQIRWGIVRGISDGPEDMLPTQSLSWISPGGRVRGDRIALDLIRRPALLPGVLALGRRSRVALAAAGARLADLIRSELDGAAS